jgi:hypothetical protein
MTGMVGMHAAADGGLSVERFFAELVPGTQTIFASTASKREGNSFE